MTWCKWFQRKEAPAKTVRPTFVKHDDPPKDLTTNGLLIALYGVSELSYDTVKALRLPDTVFLAKNDRILDLYKQHSAYKAEHGPTVITVNDVRVVVFHTTELVGGNTPAPECVLIDLGL